MKTLPCKHPFRVTLAHMSSMLKLVSLLQHMNTFLYRAFSILRQLPASNVSHDTHKFPLQSTISHQSKLSWWLVEINRPSMLTSLTVLISPHLIFAMNDDAKERFLLPKQTTRFHHDICHHYVCLVFSDYGDRHDSECSSFHVSHHFK